MINDIIRVWWQCNGMPTILQDRVVAKYVRRMLRVDRSSNILNRRDI